MSRDINKLHPLLQEFVPKAQAWYKIKFPTAELFVTHVDRTPVEQLLLFVQGRLPQFPGSIVTWKDGFVSLSKHNYTPSRAVDFGVKVLGIVTWNPKYVVDLGDAIKELGYEGKIRWGGGFNDLYHFEVV